MSSPILPIQGPTGPSIDNPQAAAAGSEASTGIGDVGAFIDELAAGVSALNMQDARNRPPREVLDQIAVAARVGAQLRDAGHELRFFPSATGGRVRIEVHDRDGNTLGTLSPAAALELAAGSTLN
jgi:hypothetical protein